MTAAVAGSAAGRPAKRPHLAPVPDSEPPFDPVGRPSGAAVIREPRSRGRFGHGGSTTVPLSEPTSTTPSAVGGAAPPWPADPDLAARGSATAQLPPAARAAQVFATALVEVLAGRRPVGQLRVHSVPGVFAGLANRTAHRLGAPAQLVSVRLCQPADGVGEVSATVRSADRARAIAFRMEGLHGRWQVTAIHIG